MAVLLFANNASSSLAGPITNVATTVNLTAGGGALFPQPGPGEYFVATFNDLATGLQNEIIWVTNVTGDVLTIQRGKEGTVAQAWAAADLIANLWTAGQAEAMVQQDQLVQVSSPVFFGVDTGAVNSMVIATTVDLAALVAGIEIDVIPAFTNTSTAVANVNSIGSKNILNASGGPLLPGDMVAGAVAKLIYNGTAFNLVPMAKQVNFKASTRTITAGGATAMALSDIGACVTFSNAGAQSTTLPDPSTLTVGATSEVTKVGGGTLVVGSFGAATNINSAAGATVNTITLNNGENVLFTWDGAQWIASGTFMARYAAMSLGQSLTANGYQKFPGGLIIQWGTITPPSVGTANYAVTFPITFPNAALNTMVSMQGAPVGNSLQFVQSCDAISTSGMTIRSQTQVGGGSATGLSLRFLVIGY